MKILREGQIGTSSARFNCMTRVFKYSNAARARLSSHAHFLSADETRLHEPIHEIETCRNRHSPSTLGHEYDSQVRPRPLRISQLRHRADCVITSPSAATSPFCGDCGTSPATSPFAASSPFVAPAPHPSGGLSSLEACSLAGFSHHHLLHSVLGTAMLRPKKC